MVNSMLKIQFDSLGYFRYQTSSSTKVQTFHFLQNCTLGQVEVMAFEYLQLHLKQVISKIGISAKKLMAEEYHRYHWVC